MASDIRMNLAPDGLTSKTSTSEGNVCVSVLSVAVTVTTLPVRPETTISDGYGFDGAPAGSPVPVPGIVIVAELENVPEAQPGVGVAVGVAVGVGVGPPQINC